MNAPTQPRNNPDNLGLAVPARNRLAWATTMGVLFPLTAATRGKDGLIPTGLDLRGKLPDLIDISNHIANTTDTIAIIGAVSLLANKPHLSTEEGFKSRRKKAAAVIGASALGLNAFGELAPYGHFTPDPVDFLYGCFGGVMAYYLTRQKFVSPADFDAGAQNLPLHLPARQFYDTKQQMIAAQRPTNQTKSPAKVRPIGSKQNSGKKHHHNPHPSRKHHGNR